MSHPPKSIFRPEAMAKYMDSQSTPVFPKIIGPGLFPKLWVLVAVLVGSMVFLGWMPITQTYQTSGFLLPSQGSKVSLFLSESNSPWIAPGDIAAWKIANQEIGRGRVSHVAEPIQNTAHLHANYPSIALPVSDLDWPIRVITVEPAHLESGPVENERLQITVTKASKRFLDWLPMAKRPTSTN